jgi:hypothetical protein
MQILAIFIIIILLSSSGSITLYKLYIHWESLIRIILFPKITGRWLWLGTIDQYRKYLSDENERLTKLSKK